MPRVVLEHITKIFPDAAGRRSVALDDVSVAVENGERVVVLGPSGSGKTTLLRLIAGLEEPTDGDVLMDGVSVCGWSPADRDVAMMFQTPALFPHLSVERNLALGLLLRRLPRATVRAQVHETAARLHLDGLLHRLPAELSGGELQRVALGRAIIGRPGLLLLDEPLSALDPQLRSELRDEILGVHRALGTTLVHVTHDQAEAMAMGQRIAVLAEGRLQQVAPPRQLYDHPANLFVAGFIGSPPMNRIHGRLVSRPEGLALVPLAGDSSPPILEIRRPAADRFPTAWSGRELVWGLRPEALEIGSGGGTAPEGVVPGATVEWLECLGAETHVHFDCRGVLLIARAPAKFNAPIGASPPLGFDPARLRCFDPVTGAALAGPE